MLHLLEVARRPFAQQANILLAPVLLLVQVHRLAITWLQQEALHKLHAWQESTTQAQVQLLHLHVSAPVLATTWLQLVAVRKPNVQLVRTHPPQAHRHAPLPLLVTTLLQQEALLKPLVPLGQPQHQLVQRLARHHQRQ